ncbi:MAG TPA: prolyl oligopeptidase family serine peptidase [Anaerolineales bacterium]|nr:prolyl oligopeptidase family serine peptidase [Anaerolineales bacterium]
MKSNLQLDDNAPWRQRFRAPVVVWTQLAPANRARGVAITNRSGKNQLYAWNVSTGELHQLTDQTAGIQYGEISGDGRYIYYLDDEQGNELGHFVRVPFENGEVEDITPDLPPYSSLACFSSASGSHFGITAADAEGFHVYSMETLADGEISELRQLFHSDKLAFGPLYSYNGEVAVVATTDRATVQHFNLLAFETATGDQIAELWDGEGTSLDPLLFSPRPGDLRLAGTTNRSGLKRPFIWNPRTNERIDLDLPGLTGEVVPLDWSHDGRRLLLSQFTQAIQQLYLYDLTTQTFTKLDHPSGTFGIYAIAGTYFGVDGEIFAQWQDAAHPSQLIALDEQTGKMKRTVLAAGNVPPGHSWKSITFPSSDGQMIQGWLGMPDGQGPFPTILHTHGGPTSVMTERWLPESQAWIDHGFAFLTINYRGSITFGREFEEKIWGNLGFWEIEDLAAAHKWLVNEGISQPDGILLTGWSYGGFITLMGLGKLPDLWAGGMAGIAIADWTMMYEDAADSLRGYQVALFGGTPQEKPEQYRVSSPITYAENVKAPVLIIQGRNDTRTPARPIEAYEQKLKALGKPIEVHWFDAGHWGAGVEQDIQHCEIMLRFAYRVLG